MIETVKINIDGREVEIPDPGIVSDDDLILIEHELTGAIVFHDELNQVGGVYMPDAGRWVIHRPISLELFNVVLDGFFNRQGPAASKVN